MMYEARDFTSPIEMARHLSRSITDPSAIRAHTANYFGKARAISDREAIDLVQAERKKRDRAKQIAEHKADNRSDKHDGEDYRPQFRQPAARKATPLKLVERPIVTVAAPAKVQKMWPDWYAPRHRKQLPRELVKAVGMDVGYTYQQMIGRIRTGEITAARSVVCSILRERGLSYPLIGRFLGGRDHSTIINSAEKFDHYCERYPGTLELFERHRDKPDAL
jgi:chromosomal replication initiator protein